MKGVLLAEARVLIKMNVPKDRLEKVISLLPAMHAPTINPLTSDDWCSIESVVEETTVREIIPRLKEAGAADIIELPLNKVVP